MTAAREEREAARQNAGTAVALRAVAMHFKGFLSRRLAEPSFAQYGELADYVIEGDEPECFVLATPLGRVYARFGFVFQGDNLVGRYEFLRFAAGNDLLPCLIRAHTILLDEHGRATYSEAGDFEWEPNAADHHGSEFARKFIGSLLHNIQGSLPKIKAQTFDF